MALETLEQQPDIVSVARRLYAEYGQSKPMGAKAPANARAHFFLLRKMFGDNDLLVIFNTTRCQYQCFFCQLPAKSSREWIPSADVSAQFVEVLQECRHALSLLDTVTLSNEGSVLDDATFPRPALESVVGAVNELRRVRRLVLETRLEYVTVPSLNRLRMLAPRVRIDILTGFETVDERIRDRVLGKREPLAEFVKGLDRIREVAGTALTCYLLFKPDPTMTDDDAKRECLDAARFLKNEARNRGIDVAIRLNPMYAADGSEWTRRAKEVGFVPPRLTDVLEVAQEIVSMGIPTYIGLSSEGLAKSDSTYMARDDYSRELLKRAIAFNQNVTVSTTLSPSERRIPAKAVEHRE